MALRPEATWLVVDGRKAVSWPRRSSEEVREGLGWEGLVDIGGVIGVFTMQNRVADGTGLPLDTPVELASRNVQQQLGVERFQSASNTERGGAGKALAARLAWSRAAR